MTSFLLFTVFVFLGGLQFAASAFFGSLLQG
jgi:hypothetical protein